MMGRHLGIDFSWDWVDFGGQVGAKVGSKKGIENRRQEEDVLEASWNVLEQKYGGGPRARHGDGRILGPPK